MGSQRRSRSAISGGRSFSDKKTSRQLWTETSREAGLVVERKDFVQGADAAIEITSTPTALVGISVRLKVGLNSWRVFVGCQAGCWVVAFEKQALRDGVNIDY